MAFSTFNIFDLLETGGADKLATLLSGFSCPVNPEIERFVVQNAIDFARKKISISYFVLNSLHEIVGFFALTHKPAFVDIGALGSKTLGKKLERYCGGYRVENRYLISAFLIAQFGKNQSPLSGEAISGNELMDCVFEALYDVQRRIGGGIIFLECENKEKLLAFYQNTHNRFVQYGCRRDLNTNTEYIQLLRAF